MAAIVSEAVERLSLNAIDVIRGDEGGDMIKLIETLNGTFASTSLTRRISNLYELDGAIAIAALSKSKNIDETKVARAYALLGSRLGLSWAQAAASRATPTDPWERLLTAGLAQDFQRLRLDFLDRLKSDEPVAMVDEWISEHQVEVNRFFNLVQRARNTATIRMAVTAA